MVERCATPPLLHEIEHHERNDLTAAAGDQTRFEPPPRRNNGSFVSFNSTGLPADRIKRFLYRSQFHAGCSRLLVLDDDHGLLDVRLVVLVLAMALKNDRAPSACGCARGRARGVCNAVALIVAGPSFVE